MWKTLEGNVKKNMTVIIDIICQVNICDIA